MTMNIDFPLILVVLTGVSGLMWLLDRFFLAPRRVKDVDKRPWYVESTAPFFPVLFIVLVVRSFIVEPFQIPSGSMIPTLEIGDFILVNKYTYGLRLPVLGTKVMEVGEPDYGDVMVFFPPGDDRYFIKRVVGLPGDEIRLVNNLLYINGAAMPQTELETHDGQSSYRVVTENLKGVDHLVRRRRDAGKYGDNFVEIVPAGHYFLVGDNRDNSWDSRAWGSVPEENIVGRAFVIWMHWEKMLSVPSFDRVGAIN